MLIGQGIHRQFAQDRPGPALAYRKDIQILRGLAVLLVLLYHLGAPGFGSGFLGVDIFFVISGYLMAVMYTGRDARGFFRKRAQRLFPAYFVTVVAVLPVAAVLVLPHDFRQTLEQSAFAVTFASNLGYWLEESYFSNASFKPLLHLWSLGVEVQFYLVVPLLAWLCCRSRYWVFALALASALLCFLMLEISPKTSFFWMPFRLWEFLVGFAIAAVAATRPPVTDRAGAQVGLAALVVLLLALVAPMSTDAVGLGRGHPGLIALVVSLATGGILYFGLPGSVEGHPAASLLERLGRVSYSVYLAHFPVLALMFYRPFSGTSTEPANAYQWVAALVAVAIASALLYRWVEKPGRNSLRPLAWGAGGAAAVMLAGVGGWLYQSLSTPPVEKAIHAALSDRAPYRCGKLFRILQPTGTVCRLDGTASVLPHRVLLLGNSHADAIKTAFSQVAQAQGYSTYLTVHNAPLAPGGPSARELVGMAQAIDAELIVIHTSAHALRPDKVEQLLALTEPYGTRVAVLLPSPEWEASVPEMLWRHERFGDPLPVRTRRDYLQSNRGVLDSLARINHPRLRLYPIVDALCRPVCELQTEAGAPLYFDAHHLTLTGAKQLRPVFERLLSRQHAPSETDGTRQ